MLDLPALRLAVFTDLHVGATTANQWHNRFLSDAPEETAAATIAAINAENPDIVLVTGDLSDTASDKQLREARRVLDGLRAPWVVCRGNHDQPLSGGRTAFAEHFGDRSPAGITGPELLLPDGVMAVVLDADWRTEGDQWQVFIPEEQIAAIEPELEQRRPRLLILACHFPFVRQSQYVQSRDPDGKNAGTLWDGEQALERLARHAAATLAFTGHQHFHHITTGERWLHCTTASLAEYPAEYRVIDIDPDGVRIYTACSVPDLIAANPPDITWVRGRPEDREVIWPPSS